MKKFLLGALALLSMSAFGQNVNIPDTNFRNALLAHGTTIIGTGISTIDTNGDGEIQVSEAQAYYGEIHVNNMGIKSVTGIEAFTNLFKFHGMDNNITSIDLSQNTNLYHVSLTRNQLTSIDLSQNDNLGWAYCDSNNLVYANAHNLTNGYGGSVFNFRGNPLLTCIEVENGTAPHMFWVKDATASWSANCNIPCIVHIPDSTFKAILVGNNAINTNGDTEIQCSEASAYTGTINVSNQTSIIELTGLEAFTNITELYCANIQLGSLDVSANTALASLQCHNNQLNSLDVSANTALSILSCDNNQLSTLDVSANTGLTELRCHHNQLLSLDVSINTALSILSCNNNQLSTLDISANTGLMELFCNNTQITSLDVSANTFLTTLQCGNNNQLTSLNLANGNNGVVVYSNLYYVNATNNPNLTCIQHDTGFDPTTTTNWQKDATASWSDNCPPVSSCANIVNIPDANFKAALLDHGVGITGTGISVIDTDGDGEICQTEAQNYTGRIDVSSKSISDLTGIETFVNATILQCQANQLSSLDVSANTALIHLYCNGNQISSLDVSANTALLRLNCNNNQLTNLNVANGNNGANPPNLFTVFAAYNPNLTCIQHDAGFDPTSAGFDPITFSGWTKDATASWSDNCPPVSSCANIVNIPDANFKNALLAHGTSITGAGISTIDTDGDGEICETEAQAYTGTINVNAQNISDLTGIEAFVNTTKLYCYSNQLTSLDVSANIALTELNCGSNQLNSIDVSVNTALTQFLCLGNQLTSLDVSTNTALTELSCHSNQLSALNVSMNSNLEELNCNDNQLVSLDVSNNTDLAYLDCYNNSLTDLNVANTNNGLNFPNFYYLNATGNPNLTCIQHDTGFDPTTSSQWTKDATAQWSDNCSGGSSGINENNISFSIVPNPTSGMVKIKTEVEISSVEIFSTSGQKVASFETKAFDISALQSGVYFVKVLSNGGSFTTRIIRE